MQTQSPQSLSSQFYTWQGYRCSYEVYGAVAESKKTPLLTIHPVGVGLDRLFWQRFCSAWQEVKPNYPIYNPDLLGCGEGDLPRVAYTPRDWGAQLFEMLQSVVRQPAIVIVQGASLPIALDLVRRQAPIRALIMATPPAWSVLTKQSRDWQERLAWNLLDSPVGNLFYRYARRREFLCSFSTRQLFERDRDVDSQWLDMLQAGSRDLETRHAVFSFLAGFWRRDYTADVEAVTQPSLVVMGNRASSISRDQPPETPQERLDTYCQHLPQGRGKLIEGRNVLPYESTPAFVEACTSFVDELEAIAEPAS